MENRFSKRNEKDEKLYISGEIEDDLTITRKWGLFFSVLGFIVVLAIIVASLNLIRTFGQSEVSTMRKILTISGYLIVAALYFFPVLYLLKFSRSLKKAFKNRNQLNLSSAFLHLKNHFQFIGIITIIIFIIYIILLMFVEGLSLFI